MTTRSAISKRAWRRRKREGGKATCFYCGRNIYAGGVIIGVRQYHKTCFAFAKAGFRPKQVGMNPIVLTDEERQELIKASRPEGVTIVFTEHSRRHILERLHAHNLVSKVRIVSPWHDAYRITRAGRALLKKAVNPRARAAWR